MIGQHNAVYFVHFQSSFGILKHKHRTLSTTCAHLHTLDALNDKRKFGQASDPKYIIPCGTVSIYLRSLETSYDLQHTSGSWYPPIDLRFKRVSTISKSQRRSTHVRYPFTFITGLSVRRRSFPVTCCALIELTLSRHCSVYGKHNSTESVAL